MLALFPETPPDAPPDAIRDLLREARDGELGAEIQLLYENTFGSNPEVSIPNARLAQVREHFTPAGVRKASKSEATFDKHQRNNSRFLLYLYEQEPQMLESNLVHALDDINADPDYTSLVQRHQKYKGKKSLETRKKEYRQGLLREEICRALGSPGTRPPRLTLDFEALNENIDVFVKYITEVCRKADGGIYKESSYTGQRSSLTYLYRRYKQFQPVPFQQELSEAMNGIKRLSSQANQHGEGNIYDGDRPLTWSLYRQFNTWFLAEGSEEGLFAAAFSKLTCLLACRGKSTAQVCTKHMKWLDDSLEINFGHIKDNQTAKNPIKKQGRNSYCNPLDLSSCPVTAIFDYMAMNSDIIAKPEEALFQGSLQAQSQRFSRIVSRVSNQHKAIIEDAFGFKVEDIGVHSWRKCAHTMLNCGTTAGPSGAAACIRGGHSMGRNRDVYIVQEKASDQYCGRILTGLPVNSPEFAISYADLIDLDPIETLTIGVPVEDFQSRQEALKKKRDEVLDSIFGAERLSKFKDLRQFLRIGLANHLYHRSKGRYDALQNEADPSSKALPDDSPLRSTALFTNPAITALMRYATIALPWEDSSKYFKDATGIPPHVTLLANVETLKQLILALPHRFNEMLDARSHHGTLSLQQIVTAVENGPLLRSIAADITSLKTTDFAGGRTGVNARNNDAVTTTSNMRLFCEYKHSDGCYRRVPKGWKFPKLPLQQMYMYWHCGNEIQNIPPMKYFAARDVAHLRGRATVKLCEIRKVMTLVDGRATTNGLTIKGNMTHSEVNALYAKGEAAVEDAISGTAPFGGNRKAVSRMSVHSIIRYMQQQKKRGRHT